VGKETDRKWEEGDGISLLEFAATEIRTQGKGARRAEVKAAIQIPATNGQTIEREEKDLTLG
jgi:hypothetical protein